MMRAISIPFALLLLLIPFQKGSCADGQNPYDEESEATLEERVLMLSAQAKATLDILEKQKFDKIELKMDRPYETFEKFRERFAAHGVTVRLKRYGQKQEPGDGSIPLVNIPIRVAMNYFDQVMRWGWIIYEDGSITYFDNVCSGYWPKDGVFCHESQFNAGNPEAMAKGQGQNPVRKNEGEQDGANQPATAPESKAEGSVKPEPESEGCSR